MKGSTVFSLSFSIGAALLIGGASPGAAVQPQVLQAIQESQRDVIVILRDQMPNLPPVRRAMGARAAALATAQGAVIGQLPNTGRKFRSFSTINAFATTVSAAEADKLTANPLVQAVVTDRVIKPPVRNKAVKEASVAGAPQSAAALGATDNGLCNTLEPEALQLTHTAFADPSIPQAQLVRDGNGQFVTGKGVKVAYLADGLDPTLPGFTRPDGSPVFIDYADFTGDPAGTPTAGGEAFGDASSIAAQDLPNGKPLLFDISKFVNAAHPLPSPCNIRIRGMAPGASLVGLKVFSQINFTNTSNFVQAIEYAVIHDDVDVINESFGGNPYPDNANDPISLANEAAVAAGVTVVVSAGDGGSAGTLGSPSTVTSVIESGATTQYRLFAQTGDSGMTFTKNLGYLDNNLTPFSSAGFAQLNARTVDAVAPGDSGWALCSTNQALFQDCSDLTAAEGPTPIEDFGGTSESSPLTAGEAALIIQAYRSTHRGADPSPATVKRIIMSTATDLGAPAYEQGAGLINSLAAVEAALSVDDTGGKPKPQGSAVLASPVSAAVTAEPDTHESLSFTFTNTGSTTQHLTPALETLGAPFAGTSVTLTLNPATDPFFLNITGAPRYYIEYTFKVPAGADHLDAALAWPTAIGAAAPPIAYVVLIDPAGREAVYSDPQGFGSGYGHVDVVKPSAGTWTAVIFTRPVGVSGTYSGPVHFTWGVEHYVKVGSVSPASLTLAPGASESVTAEFSMPSAPGDSSVAIRAAGFAEIPVSLRTLIPVGAEGGNFTGTLTGGNGRAGVGPYQTFAFDIPYGVHDLSLSLEIPDNGYLLEGLLVDPQGMQLSVEPNQSPVDGSAQYALQLFHDNPQPGLWKFVLVQNFTSSGNQTTLPFKARVSFNSAKIFATGLPNDPRVALSASADAVTVPIVVQNTGTATQWFFADARLTSSSVIELPTQTGACSGTVVTLPDYCALWYLPTQVSSVAFVAQSPAPINMDALNDVGTGVAFTGSPDIYAKPVAPHTIAAVLSEPEIPYSVWLAFPSLVGPYGPAGAPTEPVTTNAFVQTKGFDSAVSADSGDIWADLTLNTNTFNPLVLAPGATGTIYVTITPDPSQVGNVVSGYIYIDTFNPVVFTGDEVVRIPYTYTVTK